MIGYGCKNAKRPVSGAIVRDGCWNGDESKAIVARSKWCGLDGKKLDVGEIVPCIYSVTHDDPQCDGCKHKEYKKVLELLTIMNVLNRLKTWVPNVHVRLN